VREHLAQQHQVEMQVLQEQLAARNSDRRATKGNREQMKHTAESQSSSFRPTS